MEVAPQVKASNNQMPTIDHSIVSLEKVCLGLWVDGQRS